MTENNSLFYPTDDTKLNIARGLVRKTVSLFKFGFNDTVGTTYETIWDGGGSYSYPTVANTVVVTSDGAANDSGVKVTVTGLDANYADLSEEVTLNASGTATTGNTFIRVFRSFNSGSTEMNSDTDDMVLTHSGITVAQFKGEHNQTLMAVYTVPAGKTFYMKKFMASSHVGTGNVFNTIKVIARKPDGVFRTQFIFGMKDQFDVQEFDVPLKFTEKTDIEIRAKTSSSDTDVSASFEGVIYDDPEYT